MTSNNDDEAHVDVSVSYDDTHDGYVTRWRETLHNGRAAMITCQLYVASAASLVQLAARACLAGIVVSTAPIKQNIDFPQLYVISVMSAALIGDRVGVTNAVAGIGATEFMRVLDCEAAPPMQSTKVLRTKSTSAREWVESLAKAREKYGARFLLVDPRTSTTSGSSVTWDGLLMTPELFADATVDWSVLRDA